MRGILKKTAVMLSVLMLTGCLPIEMYIPVEKHEIDAPEEPVLHTKPDIVCIADELHECEWYSEICSQLLDFKTTCYVNERVKMRDVGNAITMIRNDYPEIFWTGTSYYSTTVTDGTKVSLGTCEWADTDDQPEMYKEFVAAADEIIAGIPDGSDYDKILYVHDYIIENTVYDTEAYKSNDTWVAGTAYSCIVNGKAVCSGYAGAFKYLMNRIGIESGICTGSNHAWNYVSVDGEYYWIDLTWDDNEKTKPEHTYFLVNDDILLRTRTFDTTQPYLPECSSLDSNYFSVNGGYFTEYDKNTVISYIESKVGEGRCEIMFADFDSYSTALYSLFGNADIRKAKGVGSSAFTYYRSDETFSVDIIF